MIWESWHNFFAMGGYGFYVWGSYLVALVCIVAEITLVLRWQRASLKSIRLTQDRTKQGNNETTP